MICKFCNTEQQHPCRGTHDALECPVIPTHLVPSTAVESTKILGAPDKE